MKRMTFEEMKAKGVIVKAKSLESKPRKPIKTKRKPSGELRLFKALYAEMDGVSEISGLPLLPPDHPKFHYQGSHLLPKGTYPEFRLDPRNVVMCTPEEHQMWHDYGDKDLLVAVEPRWALFVERMNDLKLEAYSRDTAS
jgi:hypothetical protein